jgi:hypothetical protein
MSMATEVAESPSAPEREERYPPYPASVVDRFLGWVDSLPVPAWFFYLLLLAVQIIIFNGLAWIDGSPADQDRLAHLLQHLFYRAAQN